MTKIVYNKCFGGFGLSEKAMLRYGELKGWALDVDRDKFGTPIYWRVPHHERPTMPAGAEWYKLSADERAALKRRFDDATIFDGDIPRDDPALVKVVEELGTDANGECARLAIADVPNGARYRIDEYDGKESVMTPDDYDWEIAK